MYRREDLESLKRNELIKLCKEHNIKCTGKNSELIDKLLSTLDVPEQQVVQEELVKEVIQQIKEFPVEEAEKKEKLNEREVIKENNNKPTLQNKPVVGKTIKKSKQELEKEEARLKLERRLKYNAQSSLGKPLPYKPYSGPLNRNEK